MTQIPTFAIAIGMLTASALALSAHAQEDVFPPDLPNECNLENVAGVFGFNEDTLRSAAQGKPGAAIGILDLRRDGSAAAQFEGFLERGGDPVRSQVIEGEWEVEPNCFGFIDFPKFPIGAEFDYAFVAVENATELFLIRNNPLEEADAKLLFRR